MEGLENSSKLLQQYLEGVPDFSVCHETVDDDDFVIRLRSLQEQFRDLKAVEEINKATNEMVKYFTEKICNDYNQPDFVVAWKLYKEANGIR